MKNKKELSIYVHIPFCERKCRYCDFWSGPASFEDKKNYVKNLMASIKREAVEFQEYEVISVFFGGGTPSILQEEQLEMILGAIREHFVLQENAEISIEVNPGTVSKEKWKAYHDMGINRVSIGLQSTQEEELALLGRIHTYADFLVAFRDAREAGFTNINVDLISSLPGQNVESYRESLERVIALQPEHISAYSLIIEEGTAFYQMFMDEKGREKTYTCNGKTYSLLSEEEDREIYHVTKEILQSHGYERYEISNYAKKGFACRHNCVYWRRGEYLGLGAKAASLLGNSRYMNRETAPFERELEETLSTENQMSEAMILGLRMIEGVGDKQFEREFGITIEKRYAEIIEKYVESGFMHWYTTGNDRRIALTERGLDVANVIMAEFL